MFVNLKEAFTIGIGGADGPTAVYITTKIHWGAVAVAALAVLLAAILVVRWLRNRK
ncbi:MAG: hypothetical protein PHO10_07370 [Gemmiger sp.]|nr:hypothetical protein [Gemmiger sp.]